MGVVNSVLNTVSNVVSDVGKVIDNTVSSAIHNPIQTIADIAAVATGNAALLPYINGAIGVAQGKDPTKIAENMAASYLAGQATSGLGGQIADATGSQTLGTIGANAAKSGLSAGLTGGNIGNAIENSAINTAGNMGVQDITGTSSLPKLDFASVVNPQTGQTQRAPTQFATPSAVASNVTNQNTVGIAPLTLGNLDMGKLQLNNIGQQGSTQSAPKSTIAYQTAQNNLPSVDTASIVPNSNATMKDGGLAHMASGGAMSGYDDYTQLYNTIDPIEDLVVNGRLVTPQQAGLLSAQPVVYSAEGGEIERETVSGIPSYGTSFDKQIAPKFAKIYEPKTLRVESHPNSDVMRKLGQLAEGPLGDPHMFDVHNHHPFDAQLAHAKGGALHEYQKAAPEGHHPEFITGVTGYYAHGGGTGQSDDIPAMLHDGDYVADADLVAALGDGSSKAGAQALDHFRRSIPHHEGASGHPVPAQIADGEYVFPANFVTAIGHGDNKAGAKLLDKMREEIRAHKRAAPDTKIPPKAKSPLEYLKMAAKG